MNENIEFSKGLRNIYDARFIREKLIPVALENQKWSLVVSEAHRVSELLLGGLIYLLGGNPLQGKHNLEGLVQKLEHCLIEKKGGLPFNVGFYSENGNCYGLELKNNTIRVLQKIQNVYMVIVSIHSRSGYLEKHNEIDLEVDVSGVITLKVNGEIMAKTISHLRDSQLVRIRRQLAIKPRNQRFLELKKIGQYFTHDLLMDARYSKREFTKQEAFENMDNMHRIFEISENMVFVG